MRKLSAERRADLRYLFCRTQTIEAGDQQALQGVGYRQLRNRGVEQIFVVELEQQPALADSLDQLFDEQWHAVRKFDDLAVDPAWQSSPDDMIRHGGHIAIVQPV